MKTPSKIKVHCVQKPRSSVLVLSSANSQKPVPASGQPVPSVRTQNKFTIKEHLRVQREIEERAHRFWFAKGCALKTALNDWLKAEEEVLAEFIKARTQRHPVQPVSNGTQTKTGATSSFTPATLHQCQAMSKLQLIAAFQPSL